jgi:hypothetical protein
MILSIFKRYRFEAFLAGLFFLVATVSFALGFLAHERTVRTPIILELQPAEVEES